VYAQWIPRIPQGCHIAYANWRLPDKSQGEVDLVGINAAFQKPYWAVEIKWTDRFYDHPEELKSLSFFMRKNAMSEALVTTKNSMGVMVTSFGKILFMPVACYAYTVGEKTLKHLYNKYGL